jgi:hypothetical protein
MKHNHLAGPDGSDTSNTEFTFPNIDAVTEDNWQELAAQGVTVAYPCWESQEALRAGLRFAQGAYGTGNVLTGDPFDEEEQRPLRLKPGRGVYVRPEGLAFRDAQQKALDEWRASKGI